MEIASAEQKKKDREREREEEEGERERTDWPHFNRYGPIHATRYLSMQYIHTGHCIHTPLLL